MQHHIYKTKFIAFITFLASTFHVFAQQDTLKDSLAAGQRFVVHTSAGNKSTSGNNVIRNNPNSIEAATIKTFSYTGANQTFVIPACVTSLTVQLWGAGGGGTDLFNPNSGGSGGYVTGTLAVAPGSTITIIVGGAGSTVGTATYGGGGESGAFIDWGASPPAYSASGGGRSAIQITAGTDAVTVAGGGGAGASDYTSTGGGSTTAAGVGYGGAGGGAVGLASDATYEVTSANGGTQIAGGTGGVGTGGVTGSAGALHTGGNGGGSASDSYGGGGGGGGYYGGGGGGSNNSYFGNGGGGGSSYITNAAMSAASTTTGNVSLVGTAVPAPNNTDPNYVAGVGVGGNGSGSSPYSGGNGLVVITYNTFSASITASSNTTSCTTPNGSATAAPCGGTSPYTYSWAPAGYTGGTTPTYSGLPAGTYTCTITATGGATATVTVTITQSLTASITSSTNPTTCTGTNGSATVTASGSSGYTYSWAPTGYTGGTTTTYSNLPAGTYTCTVTDNKGCTASATVTLVGTSDGLTASISSSTNPTCSGTNGSATAAHGGGAAAYTYSWAPAGYTGGTTATYSGLPAGTYTCTITDGNGCTATTSVTLIPTFSNSALSCNNSYVNMCGLNYVQASQLVETRSQASGFNTNGTGLPTSVSISGLPSIGNGCTVIVQAFLFWEGSYNSGPAEPATLTITNPSSTTYTYSTGQVGLDVSKCWGETGTVSYRQDVTNSISGNGVYNISITGVGNSGSEVDGVTLFIIYQDKTKTYSGTLIFNDGEIVSQGTSLINYTMPFGAACANATAGTTHAFALLADMQSNVNATNTEKFNGTTASFPSNFWNFCDIAAANVTSGQTTAVFNTYTNNPTGGILGGGDCYALVMTGIYWQNTTCVACSACSPLPISLLNFQATYESVSNNVSLLWSTSTEVNNKVFTIEKTLNGTDWQKVVELPGAGNSDKTLYYSATDENPQVGVSYYRLKQTDYDGNFSYSQVAPINVTISSSFSVFPNPANNTATVSFASSSMGNAILKIYNYQGMVIESKEINTQKGINMYQIDFSKYSNGLYFIMLNDEKSNVSKIVINHN